MRKVVLILWIAGTLVHCKRDKKGGSVDKTPKDLGIATDAKAFSFASDNWELQKLYTSDAWDMVVKDMKATGLSSLEVARLDTTYFVNFHLRHVDDKMFKTHMEVSPSFKNFGEMSKAITGVPLDFGIQMKCLYDLLLSKDDIQEETTYHRSIFSLPRSTNEARYQAVHAVFEDKEAVFQLTSYIKSLGILDLELYSKDSFAFMVVTTHEGVAVDTMELSWNKLLDSKILNRLQTKHPIVSGGHSLFEGWKEMDRL